MAIDRSTSGRQSGVVMTFVLPFWCREGSGTLKFRSHDVGWFIHDELYNVGVEIGSSSEVDVLYARGPSILPRVTNIVRVKLAARAGEPEITAHWSAETCAIVLNGKWPCSENSTRIDAALRDKTQYPTIDPDTQGDDARILPAELGNERSRIVLCWDRAHAGVYFAVGRRVKITRKGPKRWCVIDRETGQQLASDDTLYGAQYLATGIVNQQSVCE